QSRLFRKIENGSVGFLFYRFFGGGYCYAFDLFSFVVAGFSCEKDFKEYNKVRTTTVFFMYKILGVQK
ncbi:MAG TPA: hypothetical protein PKC37_02720, partial [Kaistella sp.]|nr:hypothetical protein [Kaistella sp.]